MVATATTPLADFLLQPATGKPQFLFVGGKGGVGKTSTSSAISIALANKGYRTLIVSTDPAHSLGDALAENLAGGKIVPIVTEPSLWALEIDVETELNEFKTKAEKFDAASISATLGIPRDIVDSLGLEDLTSIFTNPPPGIDEVVALLKIFKYSDELQDNGKPRFDRIVIDTAPTGHTVRLLQLPDFLNSVTGKLIKFRSKVSSAMNSFKSFFGGQKQTDPTDKLGDLLGELDGLQSNLARMKATLKNPDRTQFAVVTIPTSLAVAESKRLVESLQAEDIRVAAIVCNQIVSDEASLSYLQLRRRGQQTCLQQLKTLAQSPIEMTEVPYFDTEVTGVYGLRFFASMAHPVLPKTATNPVTSRKLTVFGGKGGVGKTTSAASWAVQLADAGLKVLVVSTDPAHSLGDALMENLSGVPRLLDQTFTGGQLWAMEVDPASALEEFKEIVQGAAGASESTGGSAMGLPDIKGDLLDMLGGVDTPPPGTDEVVAMTKIVTFLEEGLLVNGQRIRFDRIVLDTAPTGHTLRMLSLPIFLKGLLKKLRNIRDKTGSLGSMMGMGSTAKTTEDDMVDAEANDRMAKFESKMDRLEELLHNPKEAEFTVVTIPTELAVAESKRLVASLTEEKILVRRIIVNQLIQEQNANDEGASANAYLTRLRQGQKLSIANLNVLAAAAEAPLIQVPYFDTEVRTVYGLRAISSFVLP